MVSPHGLDKVLAAHPVFRDLAPDVLAFIAGCGRNQVFEAGQFLYREDEPADRFYLIRHGTVAVEASAPGRAAVTIQTLHEGDVLGWAWLIPPYRDIFDARAMSLVRAVSIDAACLRAKCEANHELGHRLFAKFAGIMADALRAARMQMLDVYAPPTATQARRP